MSDNDKEAPQAFEPEQEEARPRWRDIVLRAAPRLGDVYWCDFHDPEHVHLPEMWKRRPVIVVSRKNVIRGATMVLPFSTNEKNAANKLAYPAPEKIVKGLGYETSWILCDHICTVSNSRLRPTRGKVLLLRGPELGEILTLMRSALGVPQ